MIYVVWNRCFKRNGFAAFRMGETQAVGVQRLTRTQTFNGFFHRVAARMARVAVNRVGGKRMVGLAHMDADLVRPARFERAFDIAVGKIAFQHFDVGNGWFAAEFDDCHFQAVVRIASDLGFDFTVEGDDAVGDGAVDAFDRALLKLPHEGILRRQGFGNHHQPAGFLVQTVYDARARYLAQFGTVRQQAVEQRPRPVARRRMHHQSGRFVDDDDGIVFVNNIQSHRLWNKRQIFLTRTDGYTNLLAAYHFVFGLRRFIVYNNRAFFNP